MYIQYYLSNINILATVVAAVVYFVIGAVWYMPAVFGKAWQEGHKLTIDPEKAKKQMPVLMITTFLTTVVMVFALGLLIHALASTTWLSGLKIGLFCGGAFAFCSMAINYSYTGKSLKLLLIDGGYHLTGLAIAGVILSLWR